MKRRKKIIIIISSIFFVFIIGSFLIVSYLFNSNFGRAEKRDVPTFLTYEDFEGFNQTVVEFKSGNNTLKGYIYGETNTLGLVVICHGLGGGAENYICETKYFVDMGWRVFAYDATGSHNSEGKGTMGLPQSVIDLNNALLYIENDESLNDLPIMLYGHSWGGYAVTSILNYNHNINATVSIAGFNKPKELLMEQAKKIIGLFAYIEYPIIMSMQYFRFGKIANLTAVDGINKAVDTNVMIIHGDKDDLVEYNGSAIINYREEITNPNTVFKVCEGKGHNRLFLSEDAIKYIDEKNEHYSSLYENYNGNIPKEIDEQFYSTLDRYKTSELDINFFNEINQFFLDSIKM